MTLLSQRYRGSGAGRGGRRGTSAGVRRGFSLAELAVVMTIVGVISLIVVPNLEVVRFRMDGATRGTMAALVSAQRLAVQRQHEVAVSFDTARGALLIHADADNDGLRDPGERVREVTLDDRVRFGLGAAPTFEGQTAPISFAPDLAGLPCIRFLRNGSTTEEGGLYLTSLRAARGEDRPRDTRVVQVERSTGRVTWFQYDSAEWTQGF